MAFRYPVLDKGKLDALYECGAEDTWNSPPEKRKDWQIAGNWLHQFLSSEATLLDVGCFDGSFLDLTSERYKRYGIEIHPEARRRAMNKGITVVGEDLQALCKIRERIDCVTVFDVIEHVHSPGELLKECSEVVKPGGLVVVSTGNFDAPAFRLMGSAYWYTTIAEHISFVSPRWFDMVVTQLGLTVVGQAKFSHGQRDLKHYPPELIKNLLYRVTPSTFGWLRQRGYGGKDVRAYSDLNAHPPTWMTAKDHFITLLRKQ